MTVHQWFRLSYASKQLAQAIIARTQQAQRDVRITLDGGRPAEAQELEAVWRRDVLELCDAALRSWRRDCRRDRDKECLTTG